MSSLTIDEKLHLIQKMRSQSEAISNRNLSKLQHTYSRMEPYTGISTRSFNSLADEFSSKSSDAMESDIPPTDGFRFLKYRIFACMLIFTCFFALYKTNFQIKGHKVTEVNTILEEDILPSKLQDSLEKISQQLVEQSISK